MQLPLTLQLKPSRLYFVFLASGHALAGMAVCLLRLSGPLRAALLLLLVLSLLRYWSMRRLPWHRITLQPDGKLTLWQPQSTDVVMTPGLASVVWPWLIVLHLEGERRIKPLVLFTDAFHTPAGHRQLRVWLQWRSGRA